MSAWLPFFYDALLHQARGSHLDINMFPDARCFLTSNILRSPIEGMTVFQVDAELRNSDGFVVVHAGFLIPSLSPDLGTDNYYTMLFPRVLPYYPFGLYCVFQKGANHDACQSNIMADDFVRLRHTKNNTLCNVQNMTPDPQNIPTIVLDHEHLSHNFPLHNVEVSKVLSLKKVTAAEVQVLPLFISEHRCTSGNCIIDALNIEVLTRTDPAFTELEYLDLSVHPNQIDSLLTVSVLQARAEATVSEAGAIRPRATIDAVVKRDDTIVTSTQQTDTAPAQATFTPLQKVLALMKASPSKIPAPTTTGMEVFDSSVVEYGPIKTHRTRESTSTSQHGSTNTSGGHTPSSSISSAFPEKIIHEETPAVPCVTSYAKAFVQSESPFAHMEVTNQMNGPHSAAAAASSTSGFLAHKSLIDESSASSAFIVEGEKVSGVMKKSDHAFMGPQEEEHKPVKMSQRKKGRERKAAQALKKQEQQAAAAASSASNSTIKTEAPGGSAPSVKESAVEVNQNDDNTLKEARIQKPEALTRSQRKKNRKRKGKEAKEAKQQQQTASAATNASSSSTSNLPDPSSLISQHRLESEALKQPDQGKKATNHAKPGKKSNVIPKSALLTKANGISADNMPDNKTKTQYTLGSLVEPGRPRQKAFATAEPEPAKMPTLAEFNFEAPARSSNSPSREPNSTSTSYLFGDIANPGQPESGSSSPSVTKPITPPSSEVFNPVFASPPPKMDFNVPPREQSSNACRLQLTESLVDIKKPASVQHDDATISQTTSDESKDEAGIAPTGTQATNDENQAGLNHFIGAVNPAILSTRKEVNTAQTIGATAGEEIAVPDTLAPTGSYWDQTDIEKPSNIADTAGRMDGDTVAGPSNIAAHSTENCARMDGVYPNLHQDYKIRDNALFSLSDRHETEYPQYVPETHSDENSEPDVRSETAAEAGVFTGDATKSFADGESQADKKPQPDEELPASFTDAHIVSGTVSSQEQALQEANTDQQPALAFSTYDKHLYEFADDKVPSDSTLPQNRPDHVVNVEQRLTASELAAPESTPVVDVVRVCDRAIYEFSDNERPRDLTMPQNRPDRAEKVADDRLSIHESFDNERSEDLIMPQNRSNVLEGVANDSPSGNCPDRYVLTAEDENHLKTLNEELFKVLKTVKQQENSESSSRVTSGSLSVTDGLGSIPSITSVGTRTGRNSPSDFAQEARYDGAVSTSQAALDESSLSADKSSETAKDKIQNIEVAQSPPYSTKKALDCEANPPSTTLSGIHKDRTDLSAKEGSTYVWAGNQALHAMKLAAAVALLPVSLALEAAMAPVRVTKTACLITRWAIHRFGPGWLA